MPRILIVKTSSLGDVIHCLPAVTDAASLFPDAVIDWVVEETYVDVVRLHPAVRRVLPVALRRWRRALTSRETRAQLAAFRRELGVEPYDIVIDAQGLLKSAMVARMARGPRHGPDRSSAREWLAALTYDHVHAVPWTFDAVARNRMLVGACLGYSPRGEPDYGIRATTSAFDWLGDAPYCVCLTATTDAAKLWPEDRWHALACRLGAAGLVCVLPAGTDGERHRATRIAAAVGPRAIVAPSLELDALARLLAGATCAVGVDTGLTHMAAALGRPTVGVYCGTSPARTGVIAACARNVGDVARTPTVEAVAEAIVDLAGAAVAEPA